MKSEVTMRSLLALIAGLCMPLATDASTIWNGPPITVSDATQPDQITDDVWIMRGSSQGLYNSVTETGFTHFFSPENTEWADGTTANYNSLSYTDWDTWAKTIHGGPPNTVGVNAVVHLISDDVYIDIQFTSWNQGGGYSYQRATPAIVNNPPSVTVTSPADGTIFAAPATVTITASATSADSTVTNVQFLDGTNSLGNIPASPFQISSDLAVGTHTLAAIATDSNGMTATNSITINVVTPVAVTIGEVARSAPANLQFSYSANSGLSYIVQRSTSLAPANWLTLVTNTAESSSVSFTDTNATGNLEFYRVGLLPNP